MARYAAEHLRASLLSTDKRILFLRSEGRGIAFCSAAALHSSLDSQRGGVDPCQYLASNRVFALPGS